MEEQASVDVEDVALQGRDPRRRHRPQLRLLIRLLILLPLHEVAVQRPPVRRDSRVGAAGVECVSVEYLSARTFMMRSSEQMISAQHQSAEMLVRITITLPAFASTTRSSGCTSSGSDWG